MKWHFIKLSATCLRNLSNKKKLCIIKLQKQLPQNILDIKIMNVFKEVIGKFSEKDTERYWAQLSEHNLTFRKYLSNC